MTNSKTTKRALVSSVIALVLCFAMLLGTTYAWFTDSVTSTGNKIVAGNLDVDLYLHTGTDTKIEITNESAPIFGEGAIAQNNNASTLWEPGKTQVAYLSIKNNGSLDLKYRVAIEVKEVSTNNLLDVMTYAITPDATYGTVGAWDSAAAKALNDVTLTNMTTVANNVTLLNGQEHFFALSIHMDELAGNEYMDQSVTFDIKVLAGQLASEADSFGSSYDSLAVYPMSGSAAPIPAGGTAAEVLLYDNDSKYKVGSIVIPSDAVADATKGFNVVIEPGDYTPNVEIDTGMSVLKYDITVDNINGTKPVKVQLKIATGLDPNTVKLYHYNEEITCDYDPYTGYVTFKTSTFSPFTVVYDANSEYVAPSVEGLATPKADVEYLGVNAGEASIEWGNYGQWSPTEGLDSDLEASFLFACPDYENASAEEKEIIDAYRYWNCDFYVSLDRDLGANQLFLGGSYGSFGWVGFHNGDLTLEANTEIGLLESVTTNPWKYNDVEQYVGEFICGVGDVDDALEGATFTVKLRLTNPEDASEYYDVNVVTYTFGGAYEIK